MENYRHNDTDSYKFLESRLSCRMAVVKPKRYLGLYGLALDMEW